MKNKHRCPYCNASSNIDGRLVHQSIFCYMQIPDDKPKTIESNNNKQDSDNPSIKPL